MTQPTDIRYIRRLLEKFYHGLTSSVEERILAEYFNDTNAHAIPEDLANDAEVFRSLSSFLSDTNEIEVPENLESQLTEITSVMPPKKRWHTISITPLIFKAASIIAAACIVWGLITYIPKATNLNDTKNQGVLTAEVTGIHEESAPTAREATDKEETKAEKNTETKQILPQHIAQSKSKLATVPAGFASGEEDDFIEITDPEEARKIMENIGNLLASNISETDKAMNLVNSSIESYKEITKNILQ